MNRNKYADKCLSILNSSHFIQVNYDPTDKLERKLQQVLES